MADEGW
jgi:hypothetical protein